MGRRARVSPGGPEETLGARDETDRLLGLRPQPLLIGAPNGLIHFSFVSGPGFQLEAREI
jgi:hypothetical protein